jgi:hypothetical protein
VMGQYGRADGLILLSLGLLELLSSGKIASDVGMVERRIDGLWDGVVAESIFC